MIKIYIFKTINVRIILMGEKEYCTFCCDVLKFSESVMSSKIEKDLFFHIIDQIKVSREPL